MTTGLRTYGIPTGLLTVLFGVVGCGGGSGGSISLTDLATEFEKKLCQVQVECGTFADLQSCLDSTYFEEQSGIPQLEIGVDADRVDYNGDKADACIDVFADAFDDCSLFGFGDEEQLDAACDPVFTGKVEVGSECYTDEECVGDAVCEKDCGSEACCAGVCAAVDPEPDPVAIGADCADAPCVEGAYCRVATDETNTCVAVGNEGDSCQGFGAGPCADGLFCDGFLAEGTCLRPAAEGATCDPEQGFGLLACLRSDNWCDPGDTTCKKRPVTGEDCNLEVDNCIDYAYCGTDGKRVDRPALNGVCGGTAEIQCLGDLKCESDVCVAPAAEPVCGEPE